MYTSTTSVIYDGLLYFRWKKELINGNIVLPFYHRKEPPLNWLIQYNLFTGLLLCPIFNCHSCIKHKKTLLRSFNKIRLFANDQSFLMLSFKFQKGFSNESKAMWSAHYMLKLIWVRELGTLLLKESPQQPMGFCPLPLQEKNLPKNIWIGKVQILPP